MENLDLFDLLIIGGGAAGLTASIYASRYALKVGIVSRELGGMAATAHKVCNYPSYKDISGFELMQKMSEQVTDLGVPIFYEEVKEINKKDEIYTVKTNITEHHTKNIIFAAGMKRRKLNIPGEKEYLGRGVSYCATCDGAFFKNKIVSVVGGSDAALSAAMLLSEYANKVYIIYRRDKFIRAEPAWIKLVEKNKKIEVLFNEEVLEIKGAKKVESIKLKSGRNLNLDGVFIEVGSEPDLAIIENLKVKMEKGHIVTNKSQETNLKGFYAAGDITNNELKQIVTAASQGAIAANSVYKLITEENNELCM